MTARLTLICHAPTAATRAARFPLDEPLDAGGEAALARAAPHLAAVKAGPRLTAPERRARATAAALSEVARASPRNIARSHEEADQDRAGFPMPSRSGPALEADEALRDQDVGRWAGRSLADIAEAEPDAVAAWMADPAAAPHGGESLLDLLARVAARMDAWAAAGGRVAAVSHPAWVRAAVVTALGAGAASFWRVEAPPLATAAFSHDGRRWTLAGLVPPP